MNRFNGIGRLTSKPELRYTNSNKEYTKFTIAINRTYNRAETDFINCVSWGKQAEIICKYFDKGSQIGIDGRIETGNYEKDGKKVYTFDLVVENINFLDKKKSEEEQTPYDFAKEDVYEAMSVSLDDADID